MEEITTFKCCLSTSDPTSALGFEVWFDGEKFFDQGHVNGEIQLNHYFDDLDGAHEIKFVLKNKTDNDTKIDEHGNIVKDAVITIKNIMLDSVNVDQLVVEKSTYVHNNNGHSEETVTNFFGSMGCNGTVTFKFNSPMYLWLLDNM